MTAPARAPKWFGLFLIGYITDYVWALLLKINHIKNEWNVLHLPPPPPEGWSTPLVSQPSYPDMCFTILQIAYVSVVLFLLMGQMRWGWILALAGSLIFVTSRIAQLDIAIRFPAMIENDWIAIIVPMLVNAIVAWYLLLHQTATLFGITRTIKRNTLVASITIALAVTIPGRIIHHI